MRLPCEVNDFDHAFEWLDRAFERQTPDLIYIKYRLVKNIRDESSVFSLTAKAQAASGANPNIYVSLVEWSDRVTTE